MCKKIFLALAITVSLCMVSFSSTKLYQPEGKTISANALTAGSYLDKGWHEYPVCYVYSSDGTREVIPQEALEAKIENGWYEYPVTTVYNTKGESAVVPIFEAETALSDGWYPEKFATMTKDGKKDIVLIQDIEKFRSDGWFIKDYIHDMKDLCDSIKKYISGKKGSYGIYVKNLSSGDTLILNDGKYKSASIIKLYTMAGVYSEIHRGNLTQDDKISEKLSDMITVSDNYSHNYLIGQMGDGNYRNGFKPVNELCKEINCINTQNLSLFSECGDYVAYGSNIVSPVDCGIILEKIYRKELISPKYSTEMLNLMKAQTRQSKIPYPLPDNALCANKTGENSEAESDVAIVYSPECDYIICVITNNSPTAIKDIRYISKITYEYFNK